VPSSKVESLSIQAGDYLLQFNRRTLVMGILNVTPDSFSDGGRYLNRDDAIRHGIKLAAEGSDIIDIGGESTRPGAEPLSLEDEINRVIPVIKELVKEVQIPISIDTYKSEVAREALDAGAAIINDISGLKSDEKMAGIAAEYDVPVVVMHIKGTPRDMQIDPHYENMMSEIRNSLKESVDIALNAGVDKNKIIVDPGIGFGKELADNFSLIKNLDYFKSLGHFILVGPSRKSFLWKTLDVSPDETVEATAAAVTACIMAGADIVRIHDVKKVINAVKVADLIVSAPELN